MKTMVQAVRSGGWLVVMVLFTALTAGCGTPPTVSSSPPPAPAPPSEAPAMGPDVVRVGDKIEVTFSDIPEVFPIMVQRVREDGTIKLPYNVQIDAADKKATELQDAIEKAYVPKYFKRLTVAVKLEERVFYVGGQVRAPNRYVFLGEMTVLGAIKVAGDFTEFARRTAVKVTRADGTEIKVDCKKALKNSKYDLPVYPGDKIDVPRKII